MARLDETSPEAWGPSNIGDEDTFRSGRPSQFSATIRKPVFTIRMAQKPDSKTGKTICYTYVKLPMEMDDSDIDNQDITLFIDRTLMSIPSKREGVPDEDDIRKLVALGKGDDTIEEKEIPRFEGPYLLTQKNSSGEAQSVAKNTPWAVFQASLRALGFDTKSLGGCVLGLDGFHGEFMYRAPAPKEGEKKDDSKRVYNDFVCVDILPTAGGKMKKSATPAATTQAAASSDEDESDEAFDNAMRAFVANAFETTKKKQLMKAEVLSLAMKEWKSDVAYKSRALEWLGNDDNLLTVPKTSYDADEEMLTKKK